LKPRGRPCAPFTSGFPGWTTGAAEVKINGRPLEAIADPGSYLAIRRTWQNGDTIAVSLPMELHREPLSGDSSVSAVHYGPLVLAANLGAGPVDGPSKVIHSGETVPKGLPKADPLPKAAPTGTKIDQWVQPLSASELRFSAAAGGEKHELMPMFAVRDERYSVYWQSESATKSS
jgi:DUF1680 family protein